LAVLFTIVNKVKHRIKFWGCNTAVRLNLLLKDLELLEEAIEINTKVILPIIKISV
jgi:hypothetical protein